MRHFAWCLIVSGLVIGSIFVSYAIHATTMDEAVWIQRELQRQDTPPLRQLHKMVVNIDKVGAGKHVSGWKRQMCESIRRAVKASRRAIHATNHSASPHKAERMALKTKKAVVKAAMGL